MKKRIVILGPFGKVGEAITNLLVQEKNCDVFALSKLTDEKTKYWKNYHINIDILDFNELRNIFAFAKPDIIINAAAYTNVDDAEIERAECWKLNVDLVNRLVRYAKIYNSHLIHFSSDYIFDGEAGPYLETSRPNPINFYGKSKLASENQIKLAKIRSSIIRTNLLFGHTALNKPNFVSNLIDSLKHNQKIKVVDSLYSSPILTNDIAYGVIRIILLEAYGIYNFSGPNYLSRYGIAKAVADVFGFNQSLITPIELTDIEFQARRPIKAGLLNQKAQKQLGIQFQNITDALGEYKSVLELHQTVRDMATVKHYHN
ncbi:MAG TPA: NAD(P)-dependent oxidoreductase [Candidatus Kapabacteria bacterium]|jgi:dTDP-4-dehydrorhamnose reductase|nr:NAD(P)-dependent oxidoreductase [Candidatus Kapabacteria bacterium]HOV92724.1 NAD(P)-dependent oxidoreductase [Candidatus Kapabacteria bacterium]